MLGGNVLRTFLWKVFFTFSERLCWSNHHKHQGIFGEHLNSNDPYFAHHPQFMLTIFNFIYFRFIGSVRVQIPAMSPLGVQPTHPSPSRDESNPWTSSGVNDPAPGSPVDHEEAVGTRTLKRIEVSSCASYQLHASFNLSLRLLWIHLSEKGNNLTHLEVTQPLSLPPNPPVAHFTTDCFMFYVEQCWTCKLHVKTFLECSKKVIKTFCKRYGWTLWASLSLGLFFNLVLKTGPFLKHAHIDMEIME